MAQFKPFQLIESQKTQRIHSCQALRYADDLSGPGNLRPPIRNLLGQAQRQDNVVAAATGAPPTFLQSFAGLNAEITERIKLDDLPKIGPGRAELILFLSVASQPIERGADLRGRWIIQDVFGKQPFRIFLVPLKMRVPGKTPLRGRGAIALRKALHKRTVKLCGTTPVPLQQVIVPYIHQCRPVGGLARMFTSQGIQGVMHFRDPVQPAKLCNQRRQPRGIHLGVKRRQQVQRGDDAHPARPAPRRACKDTAQLPPYPRRVTGEGLKQSTVRFRRLSEPVFAIQSIRAGALKFLGSLRETGRLPYAQPP